MENRTKFKCQNCDCTFPMSEKETNHLYLVEGEDTCRLCMAREAYEDNYGDYKAMFQYQEEVDKIYFERLELNLEFGIKE